MAGACSVPYSEGVLSSFSPGVLGTFRVTVPVHSPVTVKRRCSAPVGL